MSDYEVYLTFALVGLYGVVILMWARLGKLERAFFRVAKAVDKVVSHVEQTLKEIISNKRGK